MLHPVAFMPDSRIPATKLTGSGPYFCHFCQAARYISSVLGETLNRYFRSCTNFSKFSGEISVGIGSNSIVVKFPYRVNSLILKELVGPARFERATLCLEGRCSIQLSYGPMLLF